MSNENKKNQFDGINSFCNFLDHQIKRMDDMLKIKEIYSVGKFYKNKEGNKLFCFYCDLERVLFVKEYSCCIVEILFKDISIDIMEEYKNENKSN